MKYRKLTLTVVFALAVPCLGDWKQDVGYTSLKARLGAALPTGSGMNVTHVEAPSSGNYLPDSSNAQFAGKTISPMSGASGVSSHATSVGQTYYGLSSSMAPGVTSIFAYNANDWIGSGFLWAWSGLLPNIESARVQNHSYIGTTNDDAIDADILRRIDLVVDRDGVVVAAGVNNGAGSAMPKLECSAYNVLAVGLTNGNSSFGPTRVDIAGRSKPDIVVPASQTSFGTPMVASAAVILVQAADNAGVLSNLPAQRQKPGKALLARMLLMAGATKAEFTDWRKGFATPSTDGTVPLDYRYGAGELNIDNSFRILEAGQQFGGPLTDVTPTGWDYETIAGGGTQSYFFEVPAFQYVKELSILVAWNRHVTTEAGYPVALTPSLANIDLRLQRAAGFTAGPLIDQSVSTLDNVEHIFLRYLPAGRYVFTVSSDATWEYAIAWDASLAATAGVDFDGDGNVDGAESQAFSGCSSGPFVPISPGCEFWDLDQDSDIDQIDFGLLQACLGASQVSSPPGCFGP